MDVNHGNPGRTEERLQQKSGARTMGIASLVLGILALLSCFGGGTAFGGFIFSIIGWFLGKKARKILPADEATLATTGYVCSLIAFWLCILVSVFFGGLLMLIGFAG